MRLILIVIGFLFEYRRIEIINSIKQSFTWFLLLLTLITTALIFYFYTKDSNIKKKVNMLEMQNQLLEINYKKINSIYTENAKLFHDFNNHLNILYQLVQNEKFNEAKSYIENISSPVKQLSGISWTGLDILDIIINSKLEQAKAMGIKFDINVEFPVNTQILSHDICTILSNLLDNAIEATSQCESEKTIILTIRKIHYFLFIKLTNPSTNATSNFALYPPTTKSNKNLHGFGLPNVYSVIEKYNGSLKCTNENSNFKVTILIPL